MKNRLLISVAAVALMAGAGFANAQGTGKAESGGAQQMQQGTQPTGGATQHSSTMDKQNKGTVGQAGGQSGSMKSSPSAEDRSSGGMNKNQATEEKGGTAKGQRSDEHAQGQQSGQSKGMSADQTKSGSKDMKAEDRTKAGTSTTESRQGQTGTSSTQTESGRTGQAGTNAQTQTGTGSAQTTGQAGAAAKLSTEQRTQITSVIREERVAPVTNVNFSISIGTRIPREGVVLHPLPRRVVEIYPEWRAYRFILVRNEIVIVNPDTYEIVAVLEA